MSVPGSFCGVRDLSTHTTHVFRVASEFPMQSRKMHSSENILPALSHDFIIEEQRMRNDLYVYDVAQEKTRIFKDILGSYPWSSSFVVHEPTARV